MKLISCERLPDRKVGKLNARAAAAVVSSVFHRSAFRFNFRWAGAAFHFHDLVPQQRGPLELEIGRRALNFIGAKQKLIYSFQRSASGRFRARFSGDTYLACSIGRGSAIFLHRQSRLHLHTRGGTDPVGAFVK